MASLEDFLSTLSIDTILMFYRSQTFKTLKILRSVSEYISNKIIFKNAVLDSFQKQSYTDLQQRIRELETTQPNEHLHVLRKVPKKESPIEKARRLRPMLSLKRKIDEVIEYEEDDDEYHGTNKNSKPSTSKSDSRINEKMGQYGGGVRQSTLNDDDDDDDEEGVNDTINDDSTQTTNMENEKEIEEEDQNTEKYYILMGESEAFIKKFALTSRRLHFTFRPIDSEQPHDWIKKAFQNLIEYATMGFQPNDQIGIIINNEDYPTKPVGIPFRKLSQLNADVVMDIISKVMQSNESFFTNDKMFINLDVVSIPSGNGYSVLDGKCVSFKEFCKGKYSIFHVELDRLCLAGALIIAIEWERSGYNRSVFKKFNGQKGLKLLKEMATDLCNRTSINIDQGASYEHINQFQNYFINDYIIVVYDKRDGSSMYFRTDMTNSKPRLNLLFEENHFNVILSLTGVFSSKFYCELCLTRYEKPERHTNCRFKCSSCLSSPPCSKDNNLIKCDDCLKQFRGNDCLQNHKKTKLCDRIKRCKTCFRYTYPNQKKQKHVCGVAYCTICKSDKPIRHLCHMQPNNPTENQNDMLDGKRYLLVFYDFETTQDHQVGENHYQHRVNLCVMQQVCSKCEGDEDMSNSCDSCGVRQKIFSKDPVQNLLNHIADKSKVFKVTAVAHNMKGFDGCFIMQNIFSQANRWQPEIIRTGTKIMIIKCGKSIRFIDSLNFIQLPLSQFPKAFKIDGVKGFFPHFFNTEANRNYIGKIPNIEFYGCDTMKDITRTEFLEWYDTQIRNNYVFDMNTEIRKYCVSDVDILRKGCIAFRKCFQTVCNVDPLLECFTIASACNLVYRRKFLKPDTIGIVPRNGYRNVDNQSDIAICWLLWQEYLLGYKLQHAGNGREMRLKENLVVDGYSSRDNTVYEFMGCYFHGCDRCYPDNGADLPDRKKRDRETMAERRERTLFKEQRIIDAGYNLITKWECDFRKDIKEDDDLKLFVENQISSKNIPLNPRESFYGGRVNCVKLYHKCEPDEQIKYFDVCSLYPFVNKYGKYPVGHPKIHVGHEECMKLNMDELEGLIKCCVLPPTDLYHPVLPYKCNGKLTFPLCKSCVEDMYQGECKHNNSQRKFTGTFVADELRKALEKGYQILEMMEVWEYETIQHGRGNEDGLFTEYVNTFIKIKQECSGWPSWCQSDDDKERYINEYFEREGVKLDKDKICKNAGLRYLSKLMLNSFWGKFGQKENQQQTTLIDQPSKLFELLTSSSSVVHNIAIINPEVVLATWDRPSEDIDPLKNVNVVIASYTTAMARLQLYKYLDMLDHRVLYFDTDSVIFTVKKGEETPITGDFLGDLTDEIEEYGSGSFISEFVSGGPKNYAYKFWNANKSRFQTVCKVKGITLHHTNSQLINFETIKEMVCNEHSESIIKTTDKIITRDGKYNVFTKTCSKTYGLTYSKRYRIPDTYDTIPYGYKNNNL